MDPAVPGDAGPPGGRARRRQDSVAPKSFLIRDILGDCGTAGETGTAVSAQSGDSQSQCEAVSENTPENPLPSNSGSESRDSHSRDAPPEPPFDIRSFGGSAKTILEAVDSLALSPAVGSVFSDDGSPRLRTAASAELGRHLGAGRAEWPSRGEVPTAPPLPWPSPLLCAPQLYLERWQGVLQTRLRDCRPTASSARSGKRGASSRLRYGVKVGECTRN